MSHDRMPRPTDDDLIARYHEAAALDGAAPGSDLRAAVLAQAEVTAWKHADAADDEATPWDAADRAQPAGGEAEFSSELPLPAAAAAQAANDRRWLIPAVSSVAVLGLATLLALQFERSGPDEQTVAMAPPSPPAAQTTWSARTPPAHGSPAQPPASPTPGPTPQPAAAEPLAVPAEDDGPLPPLASAEASATVAVASPPPHELPQPPQDEATASSAPSTTAATAPPPRSAGRDTPPPATSPARTIARPPVPARTPPAPARKPTTVAAGVAASTAPAVTAPEPAAPSPGIATEHAGRGAVPGRDRADGSPTADPRAEPTPTAPHAARELSSDAATAATHPDTPAPPATPPPAQRLLTAAAQGQISAARGALQQGAAANASDLNGRTALMLAARRGDVEMVRLLVSAGADARRPDRQGLNAIAYARRAGHEALARRLEQGRGGLP